MQPQTAVAPPAASPARSGINTAQFYGALVDSSSAVNDLVPVRQPEHAEPV